MRFSLCVGLFLCLNSLIAQKLFPPSPSAGELLPDWAIEMYSDTPNVWRVDAGYHAWRATHAQVKTTYSQYYKKWRRAMMPWVDPSGKIERPALASSTVPVAPAQRMVQAAPWTSMGPLETFNTNTGPNPLAKSSQSNVYCFDQSLSDPQVLYCGTEGGEVFKSLDRGLNWFCVSKTYAFSAPTAIEVHPQNPDIVLVGEGPRLRKSTDGGATWTTVLSVNDLSASEIAFQPTNPSIVLAATFKGLYRSQDGGETWIKLLNEACYDVEWKTDGSNTAYAVKNDPVAKICRFFKSTDAGQTWELKSDGWFFSDLPGVNDGGARLAVTNADPNRIYAVLIGEAKTDDSGFIGIWRSDDGGESWTLPNPPAGGPWVAGSHPNLATIGQTGGYHQGFYNLGFDASDSNPDELLAGFLNLWKSTDGATTFQCIGGYCGNSFNYVHPDCQEIEINGADVWMTSDGGIEYSDDFFETHYALNRGITSVDFWGFATGWNQDVFVGGRYHNGNTAWYEDWVPGECLSLGGGEAPTGYVNPGPGLVTYHSDLGGVIIPEMQNGYAQYFGFGKFPNESYYEAESGEMEFDPRCWNTFYVTNQNKLWKTEDGGVTWSIVYSFGSDENARTTGFEISRSNPEVMYLFQRAASSWDPGFLWKTTNGGQSWTSLPLPPGYARRVVLTLSAEEEQVLWLAYTDGANGQKVYKSVDGGQNWQNLTTAALQGQRVGYILHQAGTDGGVYLGTNTTVWYRDDSLGDWAQLEDGLPASISTCILRPFYRDRKLRLGAYGKGVWETGLVVPSRPVAQPMVNKRETACPGDSLQFDDYSVLEHTGATWEWSFPGGQPSSSNLRNPKVVYQTPGEYDVTLTVSNPNGSSTKTISKMIRVLDAVVNTLPVANDFSAGLGNFTLINPDNGITWQPIVLTSCDPAGDTAYFVENYVYGDYGQDALELPIHLDLTQITAPILDFKVAYAPYYDGNFFIDSLKVLVSDDCGASFDILYRSGGVELSTTTSGIGPGNLYEYNAFTPESCEEWREVSLDLSAYAGKFITVRILNQSGYGNNMYVDDISLVGTPVSGTTQAPTAMVVRLQPNPASNTSWAGGQLPGSTELQFTLLNSAGIAVWQTSQSFPAGNWQQRIPLEQLPVGIYWLKVQDSEGHYRLEKLVVGR